MQYRLSSARHTYSLLYIDYYKQLVYFWCYYVISLEEQFLWLEINLVGLSHDLATNAFVSI